MISAKIRRIKALIIKEFYQIVRDPSSILIAFIFPVVLLFIYGVGVSLDMDNLAVGLVMEDTGPDANTFALSMRNSKYFSVDVARRQGEIEDKLTLGKLKGIVVVPFYFTEFKKRAGIKGPIFVIADGSDPNTANFVQNYVGGAWQKTVRQYAIDKGRLEITPVSLQERYWYNEELDSKYFLLPGSIAIIMTLVGTLLTSLVIAREWERGTIEAVMATPTTLREFYLAKTITYFILGMCSMIICTLLTTFVFGVPFRGSFLILSIVSAIFLLTALGLGLLISAITRNQFISSQISILTAFLPAFMLSGFVFEISSMPFVIRCFANFIPAKYMVTNLTTLFLAGNVWELLIFNSLILSIVVVIFFSILFAKKTKRLD